MDKESRKQWVFIEDKDSDKIKNRPEWASEKDRDELILEPKSLNPLEAWINNK